MYLGPKGMSPAKLEDSTKMLEHMTFKVPELLRIVLWSRIYLVTNYLGDQLFSCTIL